ncbi:MAG: hypothetical protein SFZ23_01705 [Planctomycetota bacterium]|nr:hypothetical protein [Planctomycetota bacterium]
METTFAGRDQFWERGFYSTLNPASPQPVGATHTLTVTYNRPVDLVGVRFIEGDHFDDANARGGWFETITAELLVGGSWVRVFGPGADGVVSEALDASRPFQYLDFTFADGRTVTATGVRVSGLAGGDGSRGGVFVTCTELEGLRAAPAVPTAPSFDLSGDGKIDGEDVYAWHAGSARDLDGDGDADAADLSYLEAAARWREALDMDRRR